MFPSLCILNLQEAQNIEDFLENFKGYHTMKILPVYKQLSGSRVLVMQWIEIEDIRCINIHIYVEAQVFQML